MQAVDESSSDSSLAGLVYCNSRAKRWLDIAGAVIGLATLMPVFVLAALIVRLVDGLPPIYRQERFGFGGKPFTILKLCTLRLAESPAAVTSERIQHKPDYHMTRTGKFWRVHSVDEIIQFWLVLKGEMSLVGHRAFPVYYIPHMAGMPGMSPAAVEAYLHTISQYKPGMTALSAVNGRANLSLQQKIEYDLRYAREASLWTDCKILVRTIVAVITCEGAK